MKTWVNSETGKQKIILEFIKNGEIIAQDEILCIHPAVYTNSSGDEYTNIEEIDIDSGEFKNLDIKPEEQFLMLNSWAEGISKSSENPIKLQEEIEDTCDLLYPISSRMMIFIAFVDPEYLIKYLEKIYQNCLQNGEIHEPCLIANLIPILEMLVYANEPRLHDFRPEFIIDVENILNKIFAMNPPLKLFTHSFEFIGFLEYPKASSLPYFVDLFHHKDHAIRMAVVRNMNALKFENFKHFLDPELESNISIRNEASKRWHDNKVNP